MKKIAIILIFATQAASAQVSKHQAYIGLNLSSIGVDFSRIGANVQTFSKFDNTKVGFNLGYSYDRQLVKSLYISAGVELKILNNSIIRPHFYNDIIMRTGTIKEDLTFTRLQIPLLLKYQIPSKKENHVILFAGADVIVMNRVKRDIDYAIPFPTGDSVTSISIKQKASFGKSSSVGSALVLGIGYDFKLNKNIFSASLSFANDLSKSRLNTLQNIEDNSSYDIKFKSFEFKVAYTFGRSLK